MKIKSLLLGSAAAMVAVSGAQAADAIIVEPEPVEYVRVCDMYGAGFFYIPGTETCLRITGHVRVEYQVDHFHDDDLNNVSNHNARARGQLSFIANNETEYGTLGSNITIRAGWVNETDPKDTFSEYEGHDGSIQTLQATINLAGFRTGFDANGGGAWNRYGGYGYYNARNDGIYYFDTALFFEYGGSAGGFNYVVGIQDGSASGASGAPDVYAGLTTSFSGLDLAAIVMYDNNGGSDFDGGGGIAYKVRGDYDLSSFIPGGSIGAWFAWDDGDTDYVKGHTWGVTMRANLLDNLQLFAGYSEHDHDDVVGGSSGPFYGADAVDHRDWTVGMRWNVVSGLYVQAEWNKKQTTDGSNYFGGVTDSRDRFNLRFHRSF